MKEKALETSNTLVLKTVGEGEHKVETKQKVDVEVTIPVVESVEDLNILCDGDKRRALGVINAGLQHEYRNVARAAMVKYVDLVDEDGPAFIDAVQKVVSSHVAGRVALSTAEKKLQRLKDTMTPEEFEELRQVIKKA